MVVTTPEFEIVGDKLHPEEEVRSVSGECVLITDETLDPDHVRDTDETKELAEPPTPYARRFVMEDEDGTPSYELWFGVDEDGELVEASGHEANNFIPLGARVLRRPE